jgi:transcriptional regulator GlxA family with amidase domain
LKEDLDVNDLAAVAGLSRHHFSRIFAASEGMGPGAYLARLRLRHAVRLLQTTDHAIKNIAMDCGFADANYFSKAFRKAYGLSPQALRSRTAGR